MFAYQCFLLLFYFTFHFTVHIDLTRVFNTVLPQQTQPADSFSGDKTITANYTNWSVKLSVLISFYLLISTYLLSSGSNRQGGFLLEKNIFFRFSQLVYPSNAVVFNCEDMSHSGDISDFDRGHSTICCLEEKIKAFLRSNSVALQVI